MSRGDQRDDFYYEDVDRQDFLKTLAEVCQKTGFQVHAYCLMRNHFHLVVETPNAYLVSRMRWLLSSYTLRLNHRRKLCGHVFSGRYKALLMEGSGNSYLKTVCGAVASRNHPFGEVDYRAPADGQSDGAHPSAYCGRRASLPR
ncbi:MAG TPA: transposase [Clostridia bacterium]|nr:transposase [Clostridia bacterium]